MVPATPGWERIAVESYNEIVCYLGIMAKDEEHADDMKKLLERLGEQFAASSI